MEQVPLSADAFTAGVTAATSAFGDATRRDIYLFAHAATDGVTTAEVAQRFGLHPNVARHHLDKLAAGGYLQIETTKAASGAGRPSKRYGVVGPVYETTTHPERSMPRRSKMSPCSAAQAQSA